MTESQVALWIRSFSDNNSKYVTYQKQDDTSLEDVLCEEFEL